MENSSLREAIGNMEKELVSLLNTREGRAAADTNGQVESLLSFLPLPLTFVSLPPICLFPSFPSLPPSLPLSLLLPCSPSLEGGGGESCSS